jgi:hypothetical protein
MERIAVVGIDLAKSVFQVHGVSASGEVVVRQKLTRAKLAAFSSRSCRPALLAWKPAHQRITGLVS